VSLWKISPKKIDLRKQLQNTYVMLAVVSLRADVTVHLLEALAGLGVPARLPCGEYVAFAAIGRKGSGSNRPSL